MKKTSKALSLLLCAVMLALLVPFSASAKELTAQADGLNIARGEGQLVIYTPEKGASTGTNEWGFEIIVEDNVVTGTAKGNAKIPENGFVLSGHNMDEGGKRMGDWLMNNISTGDYVYYNTALTVTVSDKPVTPSLFYSISTVFSGANQTRLENMLIIFNNTGAFTGTNDWGYEVVCEGGIITSLGGNNNRVPAAAGSVVLSGHGTNATWLKENARLGMKVRYAFADMTLTLTYDEESAAYGTQMQIDAIKAEYDEAKAEYRYIDYTAAEEAIASLEKALSDANAALKKGGDTDAFAAQCEKINDACASSLLLLSESRPVEYRGVWIRPTQKTQSEVDAYVQTLYDSGINMICVETLYSNTMIMPMPESSLFVQNPVFGGFDVLQAYIDACHARGMELHTWMPIFYVGNSELSSYKLSVGYKKPEWLSKPSSGTMPDITEGYAMLNPYSSEVQDFLLGTYEYILKTYDIDGFQLDYIRFYARTATVDMGYNDDITAAFKAEYGVTPEYNTSASYWKDWVQFRCDVITKFVSRIRKLVDETAPDVLLSADVVPEPTEAKSSNYQDYMKWLENGYLDLLHPMAYGYGYEDEIASQVENCGSKALIAVGLGIFTDELTPADMQDQASENISLHTDGSVYFESNAFLKKNTGELLASGVYREKAIPPALDPEKTVVTSLDYAVKRINNIMLSASGIGEDAAKNITEAIKKLSDTVSGSDFDLDAYNELLSLVNSAEMTDSARTVILSDISYAVKICSVLNKELDLSGVPDFSSPEESAADSSEAGNTNDESRSGTENSSSLIVIICICIMVIAVTVLCVFLVRRARKDKK